MAQPGDFIGFSFGGIHSSELGIVRVSDGSRFTESLLPTFQDRTATVPGKDGTYYFGSDHQQKDLPEIQFAFDHLTETQLRTLKQIFNSKKPQPLIFDEKPYKYYMAKPVSTATIQYVCFEEDGERVYKGEGSIAFTAYYPYARSVHKFLDEFKDASESETLIYPDTITATAANKYRGMGVYDILALGGQALVDEEGNQLYYNKAEWASSTGMKDTQGIYDKVSLSGNIISIPVYNAGDLPTDFKVFLEANSQTEGTYNLPVIKEIRLMQGSLVLNSLTLKQVPPLKLGGGDIGVCFDTAAHLIKGINEKGNYSQNLYNNKISSGYFFKIPPHNDELTLEIECATLGNWTAANIADYSSIVYDYLYY